MATAEEIAAGVCIEVYFLCVNCDERHDTYMECDIEADSRELAAAGWELSGMGSDLLCPDCAKEKRG